VAPATVDEPADIVKDVNIAPAPSKSTKRHRGSPLVNPFSALHYRSVYFLFERAIPRSGEPASALDASLFSSDTTRLGDGRNIASHSFRAVARDAENSTVLQYSPPGEIRSFIVVVIKASRSKDRTASLTLALTARERFEFGFFGKLMPTAH
jgi:hypothetical protein